MLGSSPRSAAVQTEAPAGPDAGSLVAVGETLEVLHGTILCVGQGVATLDEHLYRAGAGQVEKTKLDRVLTGSPSALQSAAKELDPSTREAFVSGARQGIVGGFSDVMWLIAAVGIAGTVISFWLLRPDRRLSYP